MLWGVLSGVPAAASNWEAVATGSEARLSIETETIAVGGYTNWKQGVVIRAIVINGANAGTLQFQWAQSTAHASNSKILTNSCLIANKLA